MSNKRKSSQGRVLPPNVDERSDGRYMWRRTIDGTPYVLYNSDLNELKKKIVQKMADIQNNVCTDYDDIVLKDWFLQWMRVYKSTKLRDMTRKNYYSYWDWYCGESKIATMQVKKIKRIHMVEFYNSLINERGLGTGTVIYVNNIISSCLEQALYGGIININPCNSIMKEIEKPEKKKREALTVEQQALFINFISNSKIYKGYLPYFGAALGTGLRCGELNGLIWENIDLDRNLISVNHTLSYKDRGNKHEFYVSLPKTICGRRSIPIMEDVKEQLLEQQDYQILLNIPCDFSVDGLSGFVFTTHKGKPYTQEASNRVLKNIVKAANEWEEELAAKEGRKAVSIPVISMHNLRHTFCTRCLENVKDMSDVPVVSKILGHSKIETSLNIYNHVMDDRIDSVMKSFNGKIKVS
ncbi:MAG: tyrosine-type recombinase/integrase [Mobilitalea sp.]